MPIRSALVGLFLASLSLLAQTPAITEVEVNQVLGKQFNGALDFVAGKDTAIRAFLAAPAAIDPARTKLLIQRDGTTVTELAPRPYTEPVNIVEFLCPTRAACGNWQAGSYSFTATVNGETRATTPGSIVFRERQALRILVRPVKANYNGTIQSVTGDRWRRAVEYVRYVYPVAADKITWIIQDEFDASDARFNLETPDGERALWEALTNLRPQQCAANPKAEGCFDLIVGFIQSRNLGFPNGTGQGFTMGRPTNIVVASDEDMESTVAHEIAHIYGAGDTYADGALRCAVNPAPNGMSGKDWDDRNRTTSCTAGRQQFPNVSATLIPAEAQAYEVGGRGALGAKACFMGSGGKSPDYWVTPDVYKRLFDSLDPVTPLKQSFQSSLRATTVAQRIVHFSGFLNEALNVDKDPWFTLTTSEPVPDSTGPLLLRAVDSAGTVLASQALTTQFTTLTNPPRRIEWSPFDGVIRFPDNTARFEIVANGTIRATFPVNPTAPLLSGVSPTAPGSTINAAYTIRWTASATGPDPLTYLVEYNPGSNPADWMVLADDLTVPSLDEDFSTLPGGPQARIRVTATDGIRSTSAESAPFNVPYKAPEVYIDDTPATHVAGRDLLLNGEAFDPQDDIIPDTRLLWRSSLSGILGSGARIVARNLVPGRHLITLSATNSLGLSTVDSVIVIVTPAPETVAVATPCPLPNALPGTTYSQFLTATGGRAPYTFSISNGTLPAGLSLLNLNGNWTIAGGPTALGTSSFVLNVADSSVPVQTASRSCALTVGQLPTVPVPVVPGPPTALRLVQGDSQSGVAGQQLPLAFVAQLVDASGLSVVGRSVTWEILTPGTINLDNVISTTDSTGRVSALGVLGNVAGTHQVRVNFGTLSQTFQFTVTLAGLRLARVSGDGQAGYINRPFSSPLLVELRDGNNRPVPTQSIQWSVVTGAATLSAPSSMTDSTGRAAVTVTAGATPGEITIRATVANQTQTFTLNAYPPGPLVAASAIGTTARNAPGIVPCALTTLVGTAIIPGIVGVVNPDPAIGVLPLSYDGYAVEIGGLRAPIYGFANQDGSESIVVQTPCELPAPGRTQVVIRTPGGQQRVEGVQVFAAAPGIFESVGVRPIAGVTRPDGTYVSESNPARRGETVRLAVTGLGQTNPASITNREGVANQSALVTPQVRVADTPARVLSAVTAPGLLGVYYVSFEVPASLAPGSFLPLLLTVQTANGESVPSNASVLAAVQ